MKREWKVWCTRKPDGTIAKLWRTRREARQFALDGYDIVRSIVSWDDGKKAKKPRFPEVKEAVDRAHADLSIMLSATAGNKKAKKRRSVKK